ncbi:MAG TPA: amidohydrolase family protein [Candidatus Limnocylindrales bacterium]|nr:amidohydrolase family protein [Candidatus Limnocylindrales bacterium]
MARDAFDERYFDGIDAEDTTPQAVPPVMGGVVAAPRGPLALKGCVITPSKRIDDGYVTIEDDRITSVTKKKPEPGVDVVDTGGVILPGLIDLHGHPEFNVFAPWEPPRLFENRHKWRDSKEYEKVVKIPWKALAGTDPGPSLLPTLTRYAEARALVGGTTAIQGASAKYPDPTESLVRNVDRKLFGAHKARSAIDFDRESPSTRKLRRKQIADGDVVAYYLHLAEGVDQKSRDEFDEVVDASLLTPATVIIHGTALTEAQLGDVRDAGAKLVWSPQSNLRLYAKTTDAARALALKIPVALGADWQPSGSPSLLAEMKIARRALAEAGLEISARDLVEMVTTVAAGISGLADHIGSLAEDRMADVVVLERLHEDPWESVALSYPGDVRMVVVGGDVAYFSPDLVPADVVPRAGLEEVSAWGRPMLLDTSYSVRAGPNPPPRLADLRAALLARDLRVGPIFA